MVFVHSKVLENAGRFLSGRIKRDNTLRPYRTSLWLKGWIASFLVLLVLLLFVYLWFETHSISETHRQFMTRTVSDVARQLRMTLDKNTQSLELLVASESQLIGQVLYTPKERQEAWRLLHNKLRILFSKSAAFAFTDVHQTPLFVSSFGNTAEDYPEPFHITLNNQLTGCKSQDEWMEYSVYWMFGREYGVFIACESIHVIGERLKVFATDTFNLALLNRQRKRVTPEEELPNELESPLSSDAIVQEPIEGRRLYLAAIPNRYLFRKHVVGALRHMGGVCFIFLSVCGFLAYWLLVLDRKRQEATEGWRSLEMHAEATLANIGDGVVITDSDRSILYMNGMAEKILGCQLQQVEKQPLERFCPIQGSLLDLQAARSRNTFTLSRNNQVHYVEFSSTTLESEFGEKPGIVWVFRDVTETECAMQKLSQSEERYRLLAENIHDVVWTLNLNLELTYLSPSVEALFGYPPNTFLSGIMPEKLPRPYLKALLSLLRTAQKTPKVPLTKTLEFQMHHRKGQTIWLEVLFTLMRDQNNQPYGILCLARDITLRRGSEAEIRRLAYHDELTDLPNRVFFQDELKRAFSNAKRNHRWVGLLFLDLDGFKAINDSLGHPAGDQVLRLTAERLKHCVREEDTVVRMGGDEFILILANMKPDGRASAGAEKVANKILKSFSQPFSVFEREVFVGASIGIALYPKDGTQGTQLLRNADLALYHAKAKGRNNAQFYTEEIHHRIVSRVGLESELRKALLSNELQLVWEPQVSIQTGKLTGVEALVRWHHKERGVLMPTEFLPVAEGSDLIFALSEWSVREACGQASPWLKHHTPLPKISVNFSAKQMTSPSFCEQIKNSLVQTALPASCLDIEIPESFLAENLESARSILNRLKSLGVRISVDNFGTGYSSLHYLKRFPIDTLKIDRTFVRDIANDTEDAEMVATIIAIAKNLHLDVVAEGVETAEQLEFLRHHQCPCAQGALISPPLTPYELTQWLHKQKVLVPA